MAMQRESRLTEAFETDVEGRWPFDWESRKNVLELDFPEPEYETRIDKVLAAMQAARLNTLVVYGGPHNDANVRYLTGWQSAFGDSFAVLSTRRSPIVVSNSIFHGEPMHSNLQTCWVRDFRPLMAYGTVLHQRSIVAQVVAAVRETGADETRIGFAGGRRIPAPLDRELRERLPRSELADATGILAQARRIKSAREIEVIRELAAATTAGMEAALEAAVPGGTESALSALAQQAMAARGCELSPFGPKCQAGVRSAMKNVFPLPGKIIQDGDLVSIDIQGQMKGYISDHARSTVAGKATPQQVRLLEACAEAEDAGIRATGPGVLVKEILEAMSSTVRRWGFEDWDWSCGHGFGLELVEEPFIVPDNPVPLEVGQTFFIEPMIVPTHMGCSCFEDMILVTENGAERLTSSRVRTW